MKTIWNWLAKVLRVEMPPASPTEILVSIGGGFLGIFFVLLISTTFLGPDAYGSAALLVASMGASAVLLFGAPHSVMAQPWSLIGGHMTSALVGVTCATFIPDPHLAAAAGVGLAIGAMQFLRCLHPPGGATALVSVAGGEAVLELGYQFVLTPVLLNVIIILTVAVLTNMPFAWRRYPVTLARPRSSPDAKPKPYGDISHADFVTALSEIDSFIDVTEQDVLLIYDLVTRAKRKRSGSD